MTKNTDKSQVIIVAAGSGLRVGGLLPKQYQELNGKPILAQTINCFSALAEIDKIIVVISKNHQKLFDSIILPLLERNVELTYGGEYRQDSVYEGLKLISANDLALIHDGARPFINRKLIKTIIGQTKKYGAAAPGLKVTDSTWSVKDSQIVSTIDRSNLYKAQTPQGFYKKDIFSFYKHTVQKNTDDVALAIKNGLKVKFVVGDEKNIKITTMKDLMNSNKKHINQSEFRTGIGYDVHAFEPGTELVLCGIKIPFEYSLLGHSDADVSMHAITDALYGAIGEGDIGTWFPPDSKEWKNMNSEVFLTHAKNLMFEKSFLISNIDCTIICEEPKIKPYAHKMKKNIAQILNIDVQQVSIKATTSESLGFVGRKEGIATQAVVTVKRDV